MTNGAKVGVQEEKYSCWNKCPLLHHP